MADKNDKTDNKDPRFDHQNKLVSRDTRIKTYIQAFKFAALAKFGMKGSALFLPLHNTKPGETSSHLHFAKTKKIAKVAPAFLKMVEGNEEEAWFKMQVWMLQFLIRDFKESDGGIIDAHDPTVLKTLLLTSSANSSPLSWLACPLASM